MTLQAKAKLKQNPWILFLLPKQGASVCWHLRIRNGSWMLWEAQKKGGKTQPQNEQLKYYNYYQ